MFGQFNFDFDADKYLEAVTHTFGSDVTQRVALKVAQIAASTLKKEAKVNLRNEIGKKKARSAGSKFANYGAKRKGYSNVKTKNGVVVGFKSLENRIFSRTQKEAPLSAFAKVHIMADPRLRWLERGTEERFTNPHKMKPKTEVANLFSKKKKRGRPRGKRRDTGDGRPLKRGRMKPTHFFSKSKDSAYPKIAMQTKKLLQNLLGEAWNNR